MSLRSIYRDIGSLRAAGAQIDGEPGFGYRLLEDPALPPQMLDRIEIEAVALGMSEVLHMGDPVLAKAARSVLAKVAATLPSLREQQLFHAVSLVHRMESRYPVAPCLDTIRQGCWREESVAIRYSDQLDVVTERQIFPLAIAYLDRRLMVLAWCCLREAFRAFCADRVLEAELKGISFRSKRLTLLRDLLSQLKSGVHSRPARQSAAP